MLEENDLAETTDDLPDETDARPPTTQPAAFHGACIERFQRQRGLKLIKRSRSGFSTEDGSVAVICAVSKAYHRKSRSSYWFAFHRYQQTFLDTAEQGYLVLGCGSGEQVLAIPFSDLRGWLESLWTTESNKRFYWHLRLHQGEAGLILDRRGGFERIDLEPYRL